MYRELREQSELCREDLSFLTQRLVGTPSPSFREEAIAGIVQDLLEELHYDLVFRDEVGNVIGFLMGSEDGPTVLLNSHMDTPRTGNDRADAPESRTGRPEKGCISGYGAACKGGLAAQVFAGHVLDRSLLPLYGTIVFAATVAQEEGSGAGLRRLLDETLPKVGVTPDLAILGEPTALHVSNGHDGWADVDVRVVSSDADGARRAIGSIRDALIRASTLAAAAVERSSIQLFEPTFETSEGSTVGVLQLRCRVKSGEAVTNCVGAVKRLAQTALEPSGGRSIEVHVHSERRRFYSGRAVEVLCWSNPWTSDPAGPLLGRALGALAAAGWPAPAVRPRGVEDLRAGTAGSLLADSHHVPTICFGPGDAGRVYAPGEFVEVEKLVDAVFGTAVLVHGAIGAPVSLVWPTRRTPKDPGHVSMTGGGR